MDSVFQRVCRDCGPLGIRIECPAGVSPEAVVKCGNCGTSRRTVGALRELAARLHTMDISAKRKSSQLVSQHRELQSLRRKVQAVESAMG